MSPTEAHSSMPSQTGSASPGVSSRRRSSCPRTSMVSIRPRQISSHGRSAVISTSWHTTEGWVRLQKVRTVISSRRSLSAKAMRLVSSPVAKS